MHSHFNLRIHPPPCDCRAATAHVWRCIRHMQSPAGLVASLADMRCHRQERRHQMMRVQGMQVEGGPGLIHWTSGTIMGNSTRAHERTNTHTHTPAVPAAGHRCGGGRGGRAGECGRCCSALCRVGGDEVTDEQLGVEPAHTHTQCPNVQTKSARTHSSAYTHMQHDRGHACVETLQVAIFF